MDENTLILSGLPNDFAFAKPRLELHFSNRRKSGADILEIKEHPSDKRKALLVYPEHEAAKKVLEKSPHKVNFKTLGVVELQVKPFKEDEAANVESCKPKPLPRLRKTVKAPFGQSEPEIEEAGPGPFLEEGLSQDCSSKTPLLLVSADHAIDEEILRLYFERFTEDDVEICSHGQKQWMLKLTSQSDLENVLSKQNHDLEGSLMSVVLYDEKVVKEQLDPHRFILSGFRLDCKCSHLSIFIQSCSRGAEHSWEILNDGERIAVTFKQDIDVEAFLKKCSTKKLQSMDITASRLEYTDSVLIEGHMDQISEEALRLYFSSTRSHGGQIKCIHWVTDAKSARVEFENYRVAHRVAEQEHNIFGVSLRTSLYYSSLQQALTGEIPSMPPSPHKCSIPVDALYLKYIQSDELCKEDFESTFKELYASISYKDDLKYPQVVLEMAVDRESLLFCRLAHTWERKCKEAFGAMLDKYIIVTLTTAEEVWERVKDKCLSRHLKAVTVYYERAKNSVSLIGQHDDVKKLQGEIQLLLSKAKEELDVEKNTVERVIPADSKEELDFVWKILSPKLGGIEHSKDEANLTLCIKGLRDDVNAAMGIIEDTKDNLSSQTLNLSPNLAEFLRSLDLKKFERNYFSHISATVFSFGDSIQILAEKQDAEKASDKIKEVLTEDVINLSLLIKQK
ncbi:hypothetical protein GJAV_G00258920 [Gymnothorax javanicus]|nr:hypothetical protein GJAV_G00258920 [Gymnothorax javanicus]